MSDEPNYVKAAAEIAARKTGLRPDQIVAAVEEYRAALAHMTAEPKWRGLSHMSGPKMAIAQYTAEGTKVVMQIDSWKEQGLWMQEETFTLGGKAFETYVEARAAEFDSEVKEPTLPLVLMPYTEDMRQ